MTVSICVRERYEDEEGATQTRFGVGVTTRLPAVGALCPFANEHGAIATQSLVNIDLGRRGVEYLADGLAIEDALEALMNADEGKPERQVHGVDADSEFAFTGEDCKPWAGHRVGENYTIAGNLLTGEEVIDAGERAYQAHAADGVRTDESAPFVERLIDALDAAHEAGGDKREELAVQSAALLVTTTEDREIEPYYEDLRVDATETPLTDLRETYETAVRGFEEALERYEESDGANDQTSNS